MGFFATSGAAIAADAGAGASWFAAGLIGMLTAIAGGMIRDVLANEIPLVMGPDELYAIPALLGAATYVRNQHYFGPQWIAIAVGSTVATVLRLAGLAFHWRLPTGPRELINPDGARCRDPRRCCQAASRLIGGRPLKAEWPRRVL